MNRINSSEQNRLMYHSLCSRLSLVLVWIKSQFSCSRLVIHRFILGLEPWFSSGLIQSSF